MSFWGHDSVANIDADRAAREVEQGAQLIDVGEPDDWFAGHLPHAILVEPELVDQEMNKLAKDKPVVVASRNTDLSDERRRDPARPRLRRGDDRRRRRGVEGGRAPAHQGGRVPGLTRSAPSSLG